MSGPLRSTYEFVLYDLLMLFNFFPISLVLPKYFRAISVNKVNTSFRFKFVFTSGSDVTHVRYQSITNPAIVCARSDIDNFCSVRLFTSYKKCYFVKSVCCK